MKDFVLTDIERNPLAWEMRCPKCGSVVNGKYALGLAPILGSSILPYFYCHCTRFQTMEPRPIQLSFWKRMLVFRIWLFDLFEFMTRSCLQRGGK